MQRILRLSISLLMGWLALGYLPPSHAAEFCADNYYINVTLPNQARWDMCWEHRAREGILLHHVLPPRRVVRSRTANGVLPSRLSANPCSL